MEGYCQTPLNKSDHLDFKNRFSESSQSKINFHNVYNVIFSFECKAMIIYPKLILPEQVY